jgi:hypothetical protein
MAGAASRTVTLNVIGNTSGATKALDDVAGKSEGTAKRASAAFGGVLSTLNSTGVLGPFGEAISKVTESFDTMGEHGKAAGAKLMALGATGVGIGSLFTAIGDKDKAASQQLKASVEAVGGSWDEANEKFEKVIKSNEKYGDDAKKTQDALAILTTGLGSADKATDSMAAVLDLAAKRHEDLTQAATDWVKINEGKGTKILATLGIAHTDNAKAVQKEEAAQKAATAADDAAANAKQKLADLIEVQGTKTKLTVQDHIALRNAQDAVTEATKKQTDAHGKLTAAQAAAAEGASSLSDAQAVQQKVQGQAAAAADTFSGHLKALKTEVEDGAAKIGQKYGPALTGLSAGVGILGSGIEGASAILGKFKSAQEAATVATDAMAASETAEGAASTLALGPILLIIAGVVAVGVAIYELWTHWDTIWGWIKGAAEAVWNWIKSNWPLLLGILLGPIGLVVGEMVKHWDAIKNGFSGVWDTIKSGATDAYHWVGDRVSDIVNFLMSIPSKIAGLGGKIFHEIVSQIPGSGLVAGVADKIGGLLHFAAGGQPPVGVPSLVGENGPELFVPSTAGTIIPNHQLGVGGGSVTVGQIVVNGSSDPAATARAVRAEILRLTRANVNAGLS